MFVRANLVDIYLQGMHDRSMRSGTELAREIKLTDWSMAGNLSNRSSGEQIPRDIVLCEVQLDNKSSGYGVLLKKFRKKRRQKRLLVTIFCRVCRLKFKSYYRIQMQTST